MGELDGSLGVTPSNSTNNI